jgi:hypothetical protein
MTASGLPASKKAFTNSTACGLHPELVGIHDTPWQQQRVVALRVCSFERNVHRKDVTPISELPLANLFELRRHDSGLSAHLNKRLPRFDKFNLLRAIFDQDCDVHSA